MLLLSPEIKAYVPVAKLDAPVTNDSGPFVMLFWPKEQAFLPVPSYKPTAEQLPLAKKYTELHESGHDEEIPYKGMALTTVVAEAKRMVSLENGPDSFTLPMSVVKLGKVAFVGFPGEPFTEIGRATKEVEGFELILPCCCANDARGYFPSSKAYSEGGYEARASRFAPGISEILVGKATEMLNKI